MIHYHLPLRWVDADSKWRGDAHNPDGMCLMATDLRRTVQNETRGADRE